MNILIIGAGEVGGHLAKLLSREKHDIVVIDRDPEKVAAIGESLDVLVYEGNGTSPSLLKQAEIEKKDMIIAVSTVDEVNILACMIAKQFGVKTKIARVRNREFTSDFGLNPSELGIDLVIHPEMEATREITRLIRYPQAMEILTFCQDSSMVAGMKVLKNSPLVGIPLKDSRDKGPKVPYRILIVNHEGNTFIPFGDDSLAEGDDVYVACLPENLNDVFKIFGHEDKKAHHVMLYGASAIGRLVAEEFKNDKDIHIKLIESDRDIGRQVAEDLSNVQVVVGDASDIDLIAREGIIDQDIFCALTDDDENNIVTSLLARHLRVPKTITLIGKVDYIPIVKTIGLDFAVNPRWLTSNAIFKFIHQSRIISLRHLVAVDAETIEFEVSAKSKAVGKQIKDIKFPKGSIVVVVEHESGPEIPVGETNIYVGDRVVMLCLPDAIKGVLKLFE